MGTFIPAEAAEEGKGKTGVVKQPKKRGSHPLALRKRVSERSLQKQSRQRHALFVINAITMFLFVGAALGWGPMQLMVRDKGEHDHHRARSRKRWQVLFTCVFAFCSYFLVGNQWILF